MKKFNNWTEIVKKYKTVNPLKIIRKHPRVFLKNKKLFPPNKTIIKLKKILKKEQLTDKDIQFLNKKKLEWFYYHKIKLRTYPYKLRKKLKHGIFVRSKIK